MKKIPSNCRRPIPKSQQGMVLLEALVAFLVFSLAVLALVGLQATMMKNSADAKYRAEASFIAQNRVSQMWADPANIANGTYSVTNQDVSNLLPRGLVTVSVPVNGQFTVTVGWTAPGETAAASDTVGPCFMLVAHCFRTVASVAGG